MKDEIKANLKAYWRKHKEDIIAFGIGAGLGLVAIGEGFMIGESYWCGKMDRGIRTVIGKKADAGIVRIGVPVMGAKKQVVFAPHPIEKGVPVKYFCADPKGAITVGDIVKPEMIDKLGFSKWSGFGADMPLQYIDFVRM